LGEAYFIGTVVVFASIVVALRKERRAESAVPVAAIAA
jgi:hypothetical protein